ncbi:MAG: transcription antitermination factor NusB [Pseudomonadota bacterium]
MKINPRARRQARRALVQALYQWQMTGGDTVVLLAQFQEDDTLKSADTEFFREILLGVIRVLEAATPPAEDAAGTGIDTLFSSYLDRKVAELDKVELAVLRLGAYELKERPEIPYRVVIDEYVELTKVFGAEASHKYINGVLDAIANDLRPIETAHHRAPGA